MRLLWLFWDKSKSRKQKQQTLKPLSRLLHSFGAPETQNCGLGESSRGLAQLRFSVESLDIGRHSYDIAFFNVTWTPSTSATSSISFVAQALSCVHHGGHRHRLHAEVRALLWNGEQSSLRRRGLNTKSFCRLAFPSQ